MQLWKSPPNLDAALPKQVELAPEKALHGPNNNTEDRVVPSAKPCCGSPARARESHSRLDTARRTPGSPSPYALLPVV
jgi:hypothetical protein